MKSKLGNRAVEITSMELDWPDAVDCCALEAYWVDTEVQLDELELQALDLVTDYQEEWTEYQIGLAESHEPNWDDDLWSSLGVKYGS